MNEPKVILYISMSLDGFIATEDDGLSWLDPMDETGENYGYDDLIARVDKYILGRKTYDVVLKLTGGDFPQAKQFDCYILSRTPRPNENGVTFYSGNLEELISNLKRKGGKNIYCDGGGEVVSQLMDKNLIDEYIVSVIPVVLGRGKRLFPGSDLQQKLHAQEAKTFKSGLVQLHYIREN